SVEDLSGRLGSSDLGGLVRINLMQKKPMLTVDLTSKSLDFDDLGVVFGIPVTPDKGEEQNAEQKKAKRVYDASARLIPDARIDFGRLAAVNADISFVAAKVVDAPMGINALTLKGTLRDSVLDFEQAVVKTSTGDLDAKVNVNATKDPAFTKASGALENVAINRFIDTPMVRGTLNGKFALTFTGSGFREAAASSNGEVGLWSNNSELAKFAVEGAGLDIGEILLIWATQDKKNPEYLKSRCLAANIAFKDGQATLKPAVLDNKDSLIAATGGVNLKNESMNIEVFARPHDVSIGTISGDIRVGGTLRNPTFEALNEQTLLQAGLSALLSTISGPLGLLPFIQTGGEPDAPCATLLADAKETGTRNNPAAAVTPKKS
ncbi:MAG: AsmA family protein, partial [Burkholderiales bacterium]